MFKVTHMLIFFFSLVVFHLTFCLVLQEWYVSSFPQGALSTAAYEDMRSDGEEAHVK